MDRKRLEDLLAALIRVGASALHIVPGRAPSLRVQRRLVLGDEATVTPPDVAELLHDLLFADHRERLASTGQIEILYRARSGRRFRATIVDRDGTQSMVLRPVPLVAPPLEELDLPEQIGTFARCRSGLVVVAGFFGSGKSTTLAALTAQLNQDPTRHIVTIEDTIELLHPNAAALLHQREVGVHVASAPDGVRQAVASGADAIVVADLRNAATLNATITAVETGCLVLGGLEAGSVVGALTELVQLVPSEQRPRLRTRLARSLRGVTAQNLLQRSHRAGRVPLVEILMSNGAVRAAIRLGNFHELPGIMQRCRGLGMQTADIAMRGLLARHLVTQEEALLHAQDRDQVLPRTPTPVAAR
jgi:twitching motility protein PilT